MSDSFPLMLTGVASGAGMGLLGGANALFRQASLPVRVAVSVTIIGGMTGLAHVATDTLVPTIRVASILSLTYAAVLLAGSNVLASALARLASLVRTSAVRWGVLGLFGVAGALATIAYSESDDESSLDRNMAELEAMSALPPSQVPVIRARTDSGRDVELKEAIAPRAEAEMRVLEESIFNRPSVRDNVIRCQPASDRTNCHGWVFTGGRYWVSGSEVDRILADNGYRFVTDPQPGDLVVYREGGEVRHTALVRYVTENQPVLVEGKWGCTGVYLHPADKSIYGESFKYYRSTRAGHLLAGIRPGPANESQGGPQTIVAPSNPDEFTE